MGQQASVTTHVAIAGKRRVASALAIAVVALLAAVTVSRADTSNSTYFVGKTGFNGYWDRFSATHPSYHHRTECEPATSGLFTTPGSCPSTIPGVSGPGDWAVDYYNVPGTPVKFNATAFGVTSSAAWVWAIEPTCGPNAALGGWTVYVDLYVNGTWEGWISYGHLDNVQVSPLTAIGNGQTLGYLKNWGFSTGCYEVSNDSGVHTHTEEWNKVGHACYVNQASGSFLLYGANLGRVGRTSYSAPQQAC